MCQSAFQRSPCFAPHERSAPSSSTPSRGSQRLPSPPRRDEGSALIRACPEEGSTAIGMAFEPVSRGRILTADRSGSVAYRACTSTSRCMCTESPPPCARQRCRMSLPALRLYHARTNGGAVRRVRSWRERPRPSGAWYGTATVEMCAAIPTPPGVAPSPSIPCGKPNGQPGRAHPGSLRSAIRERPTTRRRQFRRRPPRRLCGGAPRGARRLPRG